MRIISGYLGGRSFQPKMNKWPTRPTTDMAKEALFNVLANRMDFGSAKCLDLFGGTGSISFELASRGCEDITYVDKFKPCIAFVRNQIAAFDIEDFVTIIQKDVVRFMDQSADKYDFIFADPPYDWKGMQSFPDLVFSAQILNPDALFVLEHGGSIDFGSHTHFIMQRTYGQMKFSFFGH